MRRLALIVVGSAVILLSGAAGARGAPAPGSGAKSHSVTVAFIRSSVKRWGAVGDGVADDTAAIQAAIDSGQSFALPAGVYKVSATLALGRRANDGQVILGAGSTDGGGMTTAGRTIIRPTAAVTGPVFAIDGSGFSGYVQTLAIRDLAVDMAGAGPASVAFSLGHAFDISFDNVRVLNAPPASGKTSWKFGPGSYTTRLSDCQGGLLAWAGVGANNPTTTTLVNCDIQSVSVSQAAKLTFVGGAIQAPWYDGMSVLWLPAGSPSTPRGVPNPAGVYLAVTSQLTKVADFTSDGTDWEQGRGYPATYDDGTHGRASLYPAVELGAGCRNIDLINPAFSGLYLYDPENAAAHPSGRRARPRLPR